LNVTVKSHKQTSSILCRLGFRLSPASCMDTRPILHFKKQKHHQCWEASVWAYFRLYRPVFGFKSERCHSDWMLFTRRSHSSTYLFCRERQHYETVLWTC